MNNITEEEEELEVNLRQRVRLFNLSDDGSTWCERGIGEVSVYYVEKFNETYLLVHAEDDGTLLLENKIQQNTAYRKQLGRFIIWTDNDQVFGLSFQENDGCNDVWEIICQVQGKEPFVEIAQQNVIKEENIKNEEIDFVAKEETEDIKVEDPGDMTREVWFEEMLDIENLVLSSYERDVLEQLIEIVNRLVSPAPEDKIPSPAESRLLDLFHITEDIEETEGLQQLHKTILYLLSLRDRH